MHGCHSLVVGIEYYYVDYNTHAGSTGKAALSLQRARHSEYTPRVIVQSNNETTVMADTDRNLRLGKL